MRRLLGLVLLCTIGSPAVLASPATAQPPTPAPPVVVDGPSSDIVGLSGLAVARDGTGGLIYVKDVSGVPHVFVSRLLGGSFQAPEQVDASLPSGSSDPVLAAGNGGVLLIGFINGGQLYAVNRAGASTPYSAPLDLYGGASSPSLEMTNFGKGYLAFTAAAGVGHNVRTAYYYNGRWALESAPLNATPGDDAGVGGGRPQVAAAGDGVAIVVWGEGGHIYSRRVWGTAPSVVDEQADVPSLSGWSEVSADEPAVAAGGDSSYAAVVFREVLSSPNGSQQQSRVLINRLHGSLYDGVTQPDGLSTPGADSAEQPQVAVTEYGRGFATSAHVARNQLFGEVLSANDASDHLVRVDSLENSSPPYAVPATAGLVSNLIAWQQSPGIAGSPEIRVRYANDGANLGPELVVSSPSLGPTNAALGLAAGGDVAGDAAIAWVQGTGSSTQIVVEQQYRPPGSFGALKGFQYARTIHPVLAWSAPHEPWGPVRYVLTVDGVQMGQTAAASAAVPAALGEGPHTWRVTAVNPAGLQSASRVATVWVDTIPPAVKFTLTGVQRAGSNLHIYVNYTDAPPPEPPADASGIAQVVVKWGDGSTYKIRHGKFHVYRRAGRYRLTVIVKDRAGNTTTLVRHIRIAPRSPKKHDKAKKPRGGTARHAR